MYLSVTCICNWGYSKELSLFLSVVNLYILYSPLLFIFCLLYIYFFNKQQYFFQEMYTFIQHLCIKLIKSDRKDISNAT